MASRSAYTGVYYSRNRAVAGRSAATVVPAVIELVDTCDGGHGGNRPRGAAGSGKTAG